jgi:L-threonylcarbamoyladenylate synthase
LAELVAVDPEHPSDGVVARAASVLRAGGLLIYPTDTLYALGGVATDPEVARKVRTAKGRDEAKPLPLVAECLEQARSLCAAWPDGASRLAGRFWPGPLSLVLPAGPRVPAEVTSGTGTVAVRVPACLLDRRLCAEAGPLIATSANRAGRPGPESCPAAVAAVGGWAALALDAGAGRPRPSTLVDLTGEAPRLLRAGPVSWDDVLATIGARS